MVAGARLTRQVFTATVLFTALAVVGRPQSSQHSGTTNPPAQYPSLPSTSQTSSGIPDRESGPPASMIEKQVKARNEERQKRLIADTDRLLELATQLHTDVGKTDKNILSLDVIRRSEEIERLAHGIKERMKG